MERIPASFRANRPCLRIHCAASVRIASSRRRLAIHQLRSMGDFRRSPHRSTTGGGTPPPAATLRGGRGYPSYPKPRALFRTLRRAMEAAES
jgi:hypothetical protein